MRSLMFSLVFLLTYLVFGVSTGFACSCERPESPARELKRATAVFTGRVIRINRDRQTRNKFGYDEGPVEVVLRVKQAWKGVKTRSVTLIIPYATPGMCGYPFELGSSYIVYARANDQDSLSTSLCSRTSRLKDAREDLDELGAGREIKGGASR